MRSRILLFIAVMVMALAMVSGAACGKQAEFRVDALSITPSPAVAGESVTVALDITNAGRAEGAYTAILLIDGRAVADKTVLVAPGSTRPISFVITEDMPGEHGVEVGGVVTTLLVVEPASVESVVADISEKVSKLRKLQPKTEIVPHFLSHAQLAEHLEEVFAEDYTKEEAQIEQELLATLDLLPQDYDLYHNLLLIYSEQVVGFYDSELSRLIVVSDLPQMGPLEKVTFAHEYTHALQDQHFDLESLPLQVEDNSDLSLATLALVEGDATLAMTQYVTENIDISEIWALAEATESELLESAPPFIQKSLLFPYEAGLEFVFALFTQGGWEAVDTAFGNLPLSTEHILHPERYSSGDEPQPVVIPPLGASLGSAWTELDSDVLGEFGLKSYLEVFVDAATAATAAEGWGGDRYAFFKDAEGRKLLVLRSTWDTAADAAEFFAAYVDFTDSKSSGAWTTLLDGQSERWWQAPDLSVYLSQQGSDVLLVLAPEAAVVERILAQLSPS